MALPRLSPRRYRTIVAVTLGSLVFIVLAGGAVRLTGSGLGCSDWPTCQQGQLVAEASFHPMVEFINRSVGTGVVTIAILASVAGAWLRAPRRRDLVWLSVGLVGGVIAQIVWGGLTVKMDLAPPFVMGHFILSMLMIWDAVVLLHRAAEPDGVEPGAGGPGDAASGPRPPRLPLVPAPVRSAAHVLVVLAGVVLVSGTVVTGAGPHAGDPEAPRFAIPITDVVRAHSVAMWVLLAATVVTLWWAYRSGAPAAVRRRGGWLAAAIVAQGAIGYAQYALGIPAVLVALHLLGACAVWIAVLWFDLGLAAIGTTAEADEADEAVSGPTATPVVATARFRAGA